MKIYIDLPWGGNLRIEREPMDRDKFYALLLFIGAVVIFAGFFGLFK